ncbi:MAG: hypothetical protein M5U30_16010 [Burkholderiaceae bacterium]|nr:hypothetical protein [Burkholderiaceae bacterium]
MTHVDADLLRQAAEMVSETDATRDATARRLEDFYCYLPRGQYLYAPTRELWPGASVNAAVADWPADPMKPAKRMAPAAWLAKMRPLHQMTWAPGEAEVIENKHIDAGGWIPEPGARVFNLYRPPMPLHGDPSDVLPGSITCASSTPTTGSTSSCGLRSGYSSRASR